MKLTEAWTAALDDYVIDLAWSPDGTLLAAASSTGPVTLFGPRATVRHVLPGHEAGTNVIAWRAEQKSDGEVSVPDVPSAPVLATGGQDGAVKLWDANTAACVHTVEVSPAWVEHLAWRPGTRAPLLLAAAGKTLKAISSSGEIAHAFKPAPKTLSAIAWHPTGACAAVSYFGGVCLWDGDDFHAQKELGYNNAIHALIWSPDGRWLVSGNQDPSVHLWIPEEDQELNMSGYETKVREISFDRSSRWLATGGSNDVCVWDCSDAGPEGRTPIMLPRHNARICAVAFQHDHGLLASAAIDGSLAIWNLTRRQPLIDVINLNGVITKIAWSPDDLALAVGTDKGAVLVFNITG
ncbi:MAG TPA: WD40 repeat domain-containing protein [Opitutaceae bacterium]|nr:WD40 repeat domain-containing protein [Opitutaceae bacterium]